MTNSYLPEDGSVLTPNYIKLLPKFNIVNKSGEVVAFVPNRFQLTFLKNMTGRDVILKSRQVGMSSVIAGIFCWDFLLKENSRSVVLSHDTASAQRLLGRVKFFIESLKKQGVGDIQLEYNNKNEITNKKMGSSFYIGSAETAKSGRGDTIHNLHLSEFAFYPDPKAILASFMQAVVPHGRVIIETTANGMNYFKTFWDKAKAKQNKFEIHFFNNSFYSNEFLEQKLSELGSELYKQEYPRTDVEAFMASGDLFFDKEALAWYKAQVQEPIAIYESYHDLKI